ncbi:hypothetical protein CFREI_10735 [Corynebacterium freiburgense]|nr:hypothetical protein CFREI_10735 [Corynebacterium freiburgense]
MDPHKRLLMRLKYFGFIIFAFILSLVSVRVQATERSLDEFNAAVAFTAIGCFVFASCVCGLTYCVLFWVMGHMQKADPIRISLALSTIIPMALILPSLTFILFRISGVVPPVIPVSPTLFSCIVVIVNLAMFFKAMPPTKARIKDWKYLAFVAAAVLCSSYVGSSLQPNDLFLLLPGLLIVWVLGVLGLPVSALKISLLVSAFLTFVFGIGMVSVEIFTTSAMVSGGLALAVSIALGGIIVGEHLSVVGATVPQAVGRRYAYRGVHRRGSHAMPSPSPSMSVR